MKNFFFVTLTIAALASTAQVRAQSAIDLFQKALTAERATGDLRAAIELYDQVVARAGADRALAARALIRMADCYEKLGDPRATAIYERVVRDFANEGAAVEEARTHLREAPQGGAAGTTLRRVWSGAEVAEESNISSDGRYVSYPAWMTGDLGLRDLRTGTNHLLTNNYADNQYAQGSAISRDVRQIAYAWYNGKDRYELRVIPLQTSGTPQPRRVFDSPEVEFLAPFDWSPDGRFIAVGVWRKDRTSQIGTVSVADGRFRALKSLDWRGVDRIALSPDGRWLAYDVAVSETDAEERDVFVIATDGSRELPAAAQAGTDRTMGWSPDGRMLLFASTRTGGTGLWGVPFADGRLSAPAVLIRPDTAPGAVGVTSGGALYTVGRIGGVDVQIAQIDLTTGKLVQEPRSAVRTFVGQNRAPSWSPDGKSLAFISVRGVGGHVKVIVIRSVETGATRDLPATLEYSGDLAWTPDGQALLLKGRDLKGKAGVFRIDAATGESTLLVEIPTGSGNSFPELSPDGRRLYHWTGETLRGTPGSRYVERDVTNGAERVIFGGSDALLYPTLSPDGSTFAGVDTNRSTLVLLPVAGGPKRELLRMERQLLSNYVTWTPDGAAVIAHVRAGSDYEPLLVPLNGNAPTKLEVRTGPLGLRVHPDGRHVAFTAGTLQFELWALDDFLPPSVARRR